MFNDKVVLTRPLPERAVDKLRQHCPGLVHHADDAVLDRDALLAIVRGAHAILALLTDRIDDEVMQAAGPELKVVSNFAVGYDNIDVPAATRRGIQVTNTPGVLTDATADFAWALMLACCRRIPEAERYLRAGHWHAWGPLLMLGGELRGKTLGIIGAGRIGSAVALRSRGWEMQVLYTSPRINAGLESHVGARRVDLQDLLEQSDFVSLHCPLNAETRHLIDATALARMKSTAYLINTARGPVVDEQALVQALSQNTIAGAGLDVFEREPEIHPGLLHLENAVLAPHIASATHATREKMALMAVDNLLAVLRGEEPAFKVNSLSNSDRAT